jgi:NAD(P)-dependent dehydrogenase (short-subunit alcohol dehydrogenase family)
MKGISGTSALVTGAASGIGRAAALGLVAAGAKVYGTDIDAAGLAETKKLAGDGVFEFGSQDVTDEARWDTVMSAAEEAHGAVSTIVNNAGVAIAGPIVDFSLADWQKQMAINMDSVFLGTRAGMRRMKDTGGGSIINISSVAGLRGAAGASAYCASKGGVRLFTKAAAVECAQMNYGIRVNSVHPGIIDTPIWQKSITDMLNAVDDPEQVAALTAHSGANSIDVDAIAAQTSPMGRAGTAQEVADLIVFLASDASSYINGQEMVIDGAMTSR